MPPGKFLYALTTQSIHRSEERRCAGCSGLVTEGSSPRDDDHDQLDEFS
jgi:hypothetical protein